MASKRLTTFFAKMTRTTKNTARMAIGLLGSPIRSRITTVDLATR